MTNLSPAVLRFLAWIRDNEHHASSLLPAYAQPGEHTHLVLTGDNGRKKTAKSTIIEAHPFCEPADYERTRRMFQPNAAGLKALEDAGA